MNVAFKMTGSRACFLDVRTYSRFKYYKGTLKGDLTDRGILHVLSVGDPIDEAVLFSFPRRISQFDPRF